MTVLLFFVDNCVILLEFFLHIQPLAHNLTQMRNVLRNTKSILNPNLIALNLLTED